MILFVPALPCLPDPSIHAQAKRGMTLTDIAELPRALNPQLSPDGKSIIYHQSHADWKLDRPIWNIFRQEIGGAAAQLTFSESGEIVAPGDLRWSPDGKTISFIRINSGAQIFLMPADGGEPRALTRHSTGIQPSPAPIWSPDGRTMYFVAEDPKTAEERESDRVRGDVYAFDENYKQRHLWKVIVATGAEQQITSGDFSITSFRLSRDGTRIAMERGVTPLQADAFRSEAWVMDADGKNARILTHNALEELDPELSPDNENVLFVAEASARQEAYFNSTLFVVAVKGGAPVALVPDMAVDQATWAPDGKSIIAAVNLGLHTEFFRIDVATHRARQLTDGKHFIVPGWSLAVAANRVAFQFDEPTRFGDIWTLPIGNEGQPTRVTGVFDRLESDFALPRQERLEWKGADGTTIEGLLFLPSTPKPPGGYPLVVQMHGGPNDSDKYGAGPGLLQNYFPVLTAKGYAVLRPNYRGSSGYGNNFFRGVVNGYFKHEPTDILNGIDELVRQGIVDPQRLVVMGWSAGGHLTNKLITMTDRFKAASSGAGVSNWVSMFAQSDTRSNRAVYFGGTPWQKDAPFALYWNDSPLKDAANVKTPTLFVVGERDPRVPKEQPLEMYRALLSNGVPTHLWIAPGEGHQWVGLHHLFAKANHELGWFAQYALGETYTWEKAPDQK